MAMKDRRSAFLSSKMPFFKYVIFILEEENVTKKKCKKKKRNIL